MEEKDDWTCGREGDMQPFTQTNLKDEFITPIMILRTYIWKLIKGNWVYETTSVVHSATLFGNFAIRQLTNPLKFHSATMPIGKMTNGKKRVVNLENSVTD